MMRGRLLGSSGKGPAEWETLFGLGEVLVVSVVGWCTKLSSDVETDHPAGSVAQSTAGFFLDGQLSGCKNSASPRGYWGAITCSFRHF